MFSFSFTRSAAFGLAIFTIVFGSGAAAENPSADVFQMQSTPRPKPKWLGETIDQGKFDKRLAGYRTPKGFRLEIVADAPTVVNPVGMTFADDGTPYVLEWLIGGGDWNEQPVTIRYKDGTSRNVATMKKTRPDLVKTLVDANGDGIFEASKEVLRDELPSSILIHDGALYLSGRSTIRRYTKTKADGPFDKMTVIAQGFCGFHHHQVSGMTLGNDGRLYVTSGDDDNFVEGSDGSRATVLRTGAVFRMNPDGSRVETLSIGWRNPYRDVAFDPLFNMFHLDNDNEDGTKFTGCRLMHVSEGTDFGWRLAQGARCCAADTGRGAAFGELPGKMEPLLKTGRGAPAGLLIYNDTQLPASFRGLLYYPDVFRRLIRAYKVAPTGSTFAVDEEFELVSADDPLFRPAQMVVGPDGAMYIVDWRTDSGGAGKLAGDGEHGRIYRLRWEGTETMPAVALRARDSWAKLAQMQNPQLAQALRSEDQTIRDRARRLLVVRQQHDIFRALFADVKAPLTARITALGGLVSLGGADNGKVLRAALGDASPDIRRLAADGLVLNASNDANGKQASEDALAARLSDPDRKARRAAVMAFARSGAAGAEAVLAKSFMSLSTEERKDRTYVDGYVRAFEHLGKRGVDALVAITESNVAADREFAVAALEALRSATGVAAIPTLLASGRLDEGQRARMIRSYKNYLFEKPVDALPPIMEHLRKNPKESASVKLAALDVLESLGRLKTGEGTLFLLAFVDEPDTTVALAALRAIEVGKPAGAGAPLVRRLEKKEGGELRPAILRALRALNERSVLPQLPALVRDDSNVSVRIEALRTLTAFDPTEARKQATLVLDSKDTALLAEAIDALSTDADGSRILARRYLDKKLAKDFLPQVCAALRQHSDKDSSLVPLLAEVLKDGLLVSTDPKEIARIRGLVTSRGDALRGRAVYLNHKVLACAQCHRLENTGGNVGPDLTRVWDTQSVEKLVEAILEPSKEIKEGYQSYTVTTLDGQTHSGLRMSQTAEETVIKDSQGKLIRISADNIETVKASAKSLMPEGSIARLSFDQFIDLLAFLKDRPAQESLRTMALEWHVVGPFNDKEGDNHGPEKNMDIRGTYVGDGADRTVRWQTIRTEPDGLLDLGAIFKRDLISAYALTYVFSPKEQTVAMLVGSDDGVRVWIDGTKVHEAIVQRGAAPDTDRVNVKLRVGWQPLLARVFNGRLSHGLYLRFTGGDGVVVDANGNAKR